MTSLIESISSSYKYLFEELCYPLTRNWFLVGSPLPTIGIIIMYAYVCTKFGPNFMKNRKPYNVKNYMAVYNLLQVLVNVYMCCEAAIFIFSREYNFFCQSVDDPTTDRARKAVTVGYVFYMVKYLDFLDTIFFVLRKSDRQITTLHLHHHMVMPLGAWIGITYFPGGPAGIIVFLNSLVHSIMYTYYLLSGLGAEYKKYLWWKKHVTTLQLIQFSLYALHTIVTLPYNCDFPKELKVVIIIYSLLFMYMFGKFYYYAYVVKKVHPEISDTYPLTPAVTL